MSVKEVSDLYHKIDLPSSGKVGKDYPKSVQVAWLRVEDEKKILSASDKQVFQVLKEVIQSKVLPGTVDIGQLTIQDFDHIVLTVRVNSVGKIHTYHIQCPRCQNVIKEERDVTKIKSNDFVKGYYEPMDIKVEGEIYSLRLPRVNDYIYMMSNELSPTSENALVACALVGKEPEEAQEYIKTKLPKVESYIGKFIKKFDYGLDFSASVDCQSTECKGRKVSYDIPFREAEFFRFDEVTDDDFEDAVQPKLSGKDGKSSPAG